MRFGDFSRDIEIVDDSAQALADKFNIDEIDKLGETQINNDIEMEEANNGAAGDQGANGPRGGYIEPFVYSLYRTEQPRPIEHQIHT